MEVAEDMVRVQRRQMVQVHVVFEVRGGRRGEKAVEQLQSTAHSARAGALASLLRGQLRGPKRQQLLRGARLGRRERRPVRGGDWRAGFALAAPRRVRASSLCLFHVGRCVRVQVKQALRAERSVRRCPKKVLFFVTAPPPAPDHLTPGARADARNCASQARTAGSAWQERCAGGRTVKLGRDGRPGDRATCTPLATCTALGWYGSGCMAPVRRLAAAAEREEWRRNRARDGRPEMRAVKRHDVA